MPSVQKARDSCPAVAEHRPAEREVSARSSSSVCSVVGWSSSGEEELEQLGGTEHWEPVVGRIGHHENEALFVEMKALLGIFD